MTPACQLGGVTCAGRHWCVNHAECETAGGGR